MDRLVKQSAVKVYNDAHDDEKLKVSLGNVFFFTLQCIFYLTIYFASEFPCSLYLCYFDLYI